MRVGKGTVYRQSHVRGRLPVFSTSGRRSGFQQRRTDNNIRCWLSAGLRAQRARARLPPTTTVTRDVGWPGNVGSSVASGTPHFAIHVHPLAATGTATPISHAILFAPCSPASVSACPWPAIILYSISLLCNSRHDGFFFSSCVRKRRRRCR